MDPAVLLIVHALATGAIVGTSEVAVKEAYEGLKALIRSKFPKVDAKPLEQKPESKAKQNSVAEDLSEAGAGRDEAVLRAAQALIKIIESKAPEAAAAANITIEQLHAGSSVNIEDLIAEGSISIKGIRAGNTSQIENLNPNA